MVQYVLGAVLECCVEQANYINALAVSISSFFEPAESALGDPPPPVGELFYDIGWTFQIWPLMIQLYFTAVRDSGWNYNIYVCMVYFDGRQVLNKSLDQRVGLYLSKWLPHRVLTMDSIEVDRLLADEVRLKHWDCTLMFDVAGLEGEHDILQYVKPNALAKYLQLMMECTTNGYPK
jgi:hypothetical protein